MAVALGLIPRVAVADEWHHAMELACDPAGKHVVVRVVQYENDDAPEYPELAGEAIDGFAAFKKTAVTSEETCELGGGIEVKIKRGKNPPSPGYCSVDRGEFLSIWFDRRKIISGYTFAGCWGEGPQVDAFLNTIVISHERISLCRNNFKRESQEHYHMVPTGEVSCEEMEIAELSGEVDSAEYLPEGKTCAKVGSLIITFGSDAGVCQAYQEWTNSGPRQWDPAEFQEVLTEHIDSPPQHLLL